MRHWKRRYEEFGYDGLLDHRLGKLSPKRIPVGAVAEILRLYQDRYADFNMRHFQEKLRGGAPHPAELHVGEARFAHGWTSEEEPQARSASTPTTAAGCRCI